MHLEELKFEATKKKKKKEYFCGINIDGATTRSLQMETSFAHCFPFSDRLTPSLGVPFKTQHPAGMTACR